MTADQYKSLLEELARVAGLADASGLIERGLVKVGELDAVLVHEPAYDENLLQVRMRLGTLPERGEELTRALLEANYVSGYGGECVFSLFPQTDDVVITLRVKLVAHMSPQELWQSISDTARQAGSMWESVTAAVQTTQGGLHPGLQGLHTLQG